MKTQHFTSLIICVCILLITSCASGPRYGFRSTVRVYKEAEITSPSAIHDASPTDQEAPAGEPTVAVQASEPSETDIASSPAPQVPAASPGQDPNPTVATAPARHPAPVVITFESSAPSGVEEGEVTEDGPDNTLAIISILSSVSGYIGIMSIEGLKRNMVYLPFLALLVGGITGIVWKVQARKTGKTNGLGTTAFIMGIISLSILALVGTIFILILAALGGMH